MTTDEQLKDSLATFIAKLEVVFDKEWNDFSKDLLYKDTVDMYIHPKGTFLNPKVDDESNNWGNRGSLLASYRELVRLMKEQDIYINQP